MPTFSALYYRDEDGWWVGLVEELPGAISQGSTLSEVRINLEDAAREVFAANRDLSIPGKSTVAWVRERLVIEC